jgi:hypothetical protein
MEEESVNIPKHIWETVGSLDAYFELHARYRYEKYTSNHDAWQGLEAERAAYGIPPRFTTFEGFKQGRYRYVLDKLGRK